MSRAAAARAAHERAVGALRRGAARGARALGRLARWSVASGAVLAAGLALPACELATIRGPGLRAGDGGVVMQDPLDFFEENVEPILQSECAGCHEGQRGPEVEFLREGQYYDLVTTWTNEGGQPLIVPGEPDESRLITYVESGSHNGGFYEDGSEPVVRRWINLEGGTDAPITDAGPPMMQEPVQTDPWSVIAGTNMNNALINRVPLNTGTVMLSGAFFVFEAHRNGADLILRNVRIQAGSRGISVTQPRLYVWEEMATEGTLDVSGSFQPNFQINSADQVDIAPQVTLVDFPMNGRLSVEFTSVQYMN